MSLKFMHQDSSAPPASNYHARRQRKHLGRFRNEISTWHSKGCTVTEMLTRLASLLDEEDIPSKAQLYAQLRDWNLKKYRRRPLQALSAQRCLPETLKLRPTRCDHAFLNDQVWQAYLAHFALRTAIWTDFVSNIREQRVCEQLISTRQAVVDSISLFLQNGWTHFMLMANIFAMIEIDEILMVTWKKLPGESSKTYLSAAKAIAPLVMAQTVSSQHSQNDIFGIYARNVLDFHDKWHTGAVYPADITSLNGTARAVWQRAFVVLEEQFPNHKRELDLRRTSGLHKARSIHSWPVCLPKTPIDKKDHVYHAHSR